MSRAIPGLHHVTAIAGPPQANVGFYVKTMRQWLVKRTVNFDAPDTYHGTVKLAAARLAEAGQDG